jgi:hypothetical protein
MPTHAILVTYKDMEPGVLPEFINRASQKYGTNFTRLYFDSYALKGKLYLAVRGVPATDKLKIYISGHGGTGIDYITNDAQNQKQTVEDLTKLLSFALHERATSVGSCGDTEVNMISCLFGRTPDGRMDTSPAAKLHRQLASWNTYVNLVARTESIVCTKTGRQTISAINHYLFEKYVEKNQRHKFFKPKVQYSKILCTFNNGAPVVLLREYDAGPDRYTAGDSAVAQRSLWADYVVNELIKHIHLTATKRGMEVVDVREQKLRDLVYWYDTFHSPPLLKTKMEALLDGQGGDVATDFTIHRNPVSKIFSSELPKTAKLIQDLLKEYPG